MTTLPASENEHLFQPRVFLAWFLVIVTMALGFNARFDFFPEKDARAQTQTRVYGSGTPGFIAKWVGHINNPPSLDSLQASGGGISVPPWSGSNSEIPAPGENPAGACALPLRPFLSWNYSDPDGDPQKSYEVQVDNNSDFLSPEFDKREDSSTDSTIVPSNKLVHRTQYYWRAQVWDKNDTPSGWADGPSFSTQLHQAPLVRYTWSPNSPTKNERVQFTDETSVFDNARIASWNWTFENGAPASSIQQNPRAQFNSTGIKNTSLTVRDSDDLSCRAQEVIGVEWPTPPRFRETAPR